MKFIKKNPISMIKITEENYDFVKSICSKSGYSFHELYYINANRYFTCLQIFDFMENSKFGCLNGIIGMNNVMVTMDVENVEMATFDDLMEKNIRSASNEEEDSRKVMKFARARQREDELLHFSRYVDVSKDSVKLLTMRIYVFDQTLERLQDRLDVVMNRLYGLKLTGNYIQTNNLSQDVKALTKFDNPVKKMVCGETITDFMSRSEVNIVDKNACLLGVTTNGLYAPNYYSFKNSSYSKILIGMMGSGKSAMAKKIEKNNQLKGGHIAYIFDIHGEYADYCEEMEYPTVGIDEKQCINFFQMFYVENEDGIIREIDKTNKMAEVTETFIQFNDLNRQTDKTLIMQFEKLIRNFYDQYIDRNIEGLTNDDWFTLGDIVETMKQKTTDRKNYKRVEETDLYVLELCLDKMMREYGYLFNQKTTVEFDLNHSIRFDVSFLRNNTNVSLKSAYINLLLGYVSYGAFLNMKTNVRLMKDKGVKPYELSEPLQSLDIIIDETMEYADVTFLKKVNALQKYLRKAYASFTFVIHDTNDTEKSLENNGDLLSQLFSLCSTKIIGKVDGKSARKLVEIIPELNDQDAEIVTSFRKGSHGERSFMVVDDQKRKTVITSLISKYEQSFFGGGV